MKFHALNPLTAPIADTNLIEASAGTGKTWNLAALFARLIVLEQHRVDKILVVTFTKAATAELKKRLRLRLDEALGVLARTENAAENPDVLQENCVINGEFDDFLFQLLQAALKKESQARLQLRLKAAIGEFDHAAIYTIHGFCQRVLQDFAFLCQVPFDIQIDEQFTDNQMLTAAQDFWRTRVATEPILARLVHRHRLTPKTQLASLKAFLSRPYLSFRLPENEGKDYGVLFADFQRLWAEVAAQLPEIETAFWQIQPLLNGRNFQSKSFAKKFQWLHAQTQTPDCGALLKELFNTHHDVVFSLEFMTAKIKDEKKTPDAALMAKVAQLGDVMCGAMQVLAAEKVALLQLNRDLLRDLHEKRREWKKQRPQRQFDDLLLDLHAALSSPEHASELAQALAQNWQVALIDEFQDTDPLQYAIFRTAFAQTGTPLFLVGDPKQAIYRFRGADIFAYWQAAQDSQRHYTLDTNHRSHRKLIQSIGALFGREAPFVLPNMVYNAVQASRELPRLSPAGKAVQIRWLPNELGENSDVLLKQSAQICAAEIVDLLAQSASGCLKMGDKPLHAGQIAVLVRAHKDGALMQRALKQVGVQSVLLSKNSIFAEPEAQAMAALLGWLIQPQKMGLLRFVLASSLFDYDSAQLNALNTDENQLLAWIDSATATHEHWQQFGIYAALQQFFQTHGVECRLLQQNHERALTNFHQIMELLAQEDENSHTPVSLLQWLNREIQAAAQNTAAPQNHILRLESDEQLVKIVTMHAAKGLQYPIVFCPFVWKASDRLSGDWHVLHRDGEAQIVSADQLKQSEADQIAIQNDHLSEELRLLYVALTRAEERLYLYLTHFQRSDKVSGSLKNDDNDENAAEPQFRNALAYLLGADKNLTKQAAAYEQHWHDFVQQQSPNDTDFEWVRHDGQNAVSGSLNAVDNAVSAPYRAVVLPPRRFRFVQHHSFTSLSRQTERAHNDLTLPALDLDEQIMLPAPPIAPIGDSIHAFPQGAAAGVCLHSVLEKLVFRQPAAQQTDLIDTQLNQHGFDPEIWRDAVVQMCEFARQTPLLPRMNLANLPANQMLSEMTFLFHHADLRLHEIQAWFARSGLPPEIVAASRHLRFRDVSGFVSGAIDLLAQSQQHFVIVDYKSNHLGKHAADYTPDALNAEMAKHHYYLQAWLYAIASARYLQSRHRLPEILSVRYLFLRGLDGISDNGVWSWDIRTADLAAWL